MFRFNVLLTVRPEEYIGDWWLKKDIEIPFIPTKGTEIFFPLNTAEDADVEILVTRVAYHTINGRIEIHGEAPLSSVCCLYLHSHGWEIEYEEEFKNDEDVQKTIIQMRHDFPQFQNLELKRVD